MAETEGKSERAEILRRLDSKVSTGAWMLREPRDGEVSGGTVVVEYNRDGQLITGLSRMYPCPWR